MLGAGWRQENTDPSILLHRYPIVPLHFIKTSYRPTSPLPLPPALRGLRSIEMYQKYVRGTYVKVESISYGPPSPICLLAAYLTAYPFIIPISTTPHIPVHVFESVYFFFKGFSTLSMVKLVLLYISWKRMIVNRRVIGCWCTLILCIGSYIVLRL